MKLLLQKIDIRDDSPHTLGGAAVLAAFSVGVETPGLCASCCADGIPLARPRALLLARPVILKI